jgi:hypothetical protein
VYVRNGKNKEKETRGEKKEVKKKKSVGKEKKREVFKT